jgi:YfiH family protein
MSTIPTLRSPRLLKAPGVRHAFFTRHGGVSKGIYASLNVGEGSDDDPDAVQDNRRSLLGWFRAETLTRLYQTHSAQVHVAEEPRPAMAPQREGDGLVTATPRWACLVVTADCAPVLIADPLARVVGAAHAGWRGALDGVVESTIAAMVGLGAAPERMTAAVGPCIGPDSYEVGLEFLERFTAQAEDNERFFRAGARPDKRLFDLPAYVLHRLGEAGVHDAEWIGRDTCAEEDDFFSNRRAVLRGEPDYGRLASAIMLTEQHTA